MQDIKYNIQIMSKYDVTIFSTKDLKEEYIIISINDIGHHTVIFNNPYIKNIRKLYFDDIQEPIKDHKLMNKEDCIKIKEFIDKYRDVKNIIVHCTAGISRSGAVGCVLAKYLNGDDIYLWGNRKIYP